MTVESADPAELAALVTDVVRDLPTGSAEDRLTALWDTLDELGLTRVGVPERLGGSGGTVDDLIVIVRTLAEHGAVQPLIESAVAASVLACAERAPVGRCTLVCLPSPVHPGDVAGSVLEVPWARWASHVLVVGAGAALVDLAAPGVVVTPGTDVAGAQLDRVRFPDGLLAADLPAPATDDIMVRAGLLRAAALVGAARGAYRLTKTYVRARHQFGRPLVEIPAVAAALATIRIQVIQAETALELARERIGGRGELAGVATARVVCGAAATETARLSHQLHGAMGITAEYPLHRLTRILWAARDADLPEQRWAELLGEAALSGGEKVLWDELTSPAVASGRPEPV